MSITIKLTLISFTTIWSKTIQLNEGDTHFLNGLNGSFAAAIQILTQKLKE
jgi:hypothetical protein